ncbi:linear amide C-N hydrolase [Vibrio tubiashii]|uniref:Hydrolase n=1 Tax=Vibrio tubiashii ATCC 19109 TaxID=1051646 RepID=F9TAY9_9VIBR|nr:linear amide C-N hydrolase [Vibrio tubiashii]AIW17017.1 hydrolase [Vibrio tubiashii ATCC 19109]EGU49566.1 putative hydrolase, penicillin acylase-like protein [Vibrio tubiashii ATCC 19109]EIF03773.1 putative hydrolase, penicillin acylase-like protein [Vibrio tubiashii NCIMB 1337 = ATCC 19106]
MKTFTKSKTAIAMIIAATTTFGALSVANACTTAVYHNGDVSLSSRSMDWFGHDEAEVIGAGKGIKATYAASDNPVTSTSKFATMKIKSFHGASDDMNKALVAEAMNEKGLEARILYLGRDYTAFPEGTAETPDVSALQVPNWASDNFSTVAEVLEAIENGHVDIIEAELCNLPGKEGHCTQAPVHYQFADRTGDMAVVEFVQGELKVYRGKTAEVLTNNPELSVHLEFSANGKKSDGSIHPIDRRLRGKEIIADMYSRNVTDNDSAKNAMRAVANSTFAGYEQLDHSLESPDVFPTLWTVHTDRNAGEWVLDRYDTWTPEMYNFEMFDVSSPKSVSLGIHPKNK